jgi:O-acetyl-ADP-ribose deacetylase (regulator of RNase III)
MRRYFRHESESALGTGLAWTEFEGEYAVRQVENYGRRWFCSVRDWDPEVGITLSEGRLSELDLSWSQDIAADEFEAAWAFAFDQLEPAHRIAYAVGDATEPRTTRTIIAHVCNDAGKWGKGFVIAVSERFPEAEVAYRRWFEGSTDDGPFRLGAVQCVAVNDQVTVANMVAQHGVASKRSPGPQIRYDALAECLRTVADLALTQRRAVQMPRIGAGLAGGAWPVIEALVHERLIRRGAHATVYDLPENLAREGLSRREGN